MSREQRVNLAEPPVPVSDNSPVSVTIGDLHGNAVLLLNALIHQGVVELDKHSYEAFVTANQEIYKLLVLKPYADLLCGDQLGDERLKLLKQASRDLSRRLVDDLVGLEGWDRGEAVTEINSSLAPVNRLSVNSVFKPDSIRDSQDRGRLIAAYVQCYNDTLVPKRDALKSELGTHVETLKSVLGKVKVTDKGKSSLLREIGDKYADRGACDLPTILLEQALLKGIDKSKGGGITSIFSNHDLQFLRRFPFSRDGNVFFEELGNGQESSLQTLCTLMKIGIVKPDEMNKLVREVYFPGLKLIDYAFDEDGKLRLYTHAPIKAKQLVETAREFLGPEKLKEVLGQKVPEEDVELKQLLAKRHVLTKICDAMNEKFQREYVFKEKFDIDVDDCLHKFVWARYHENEADHQWNGGKVDSGFPDGIVTVNGHDGAMNLEHGNLNGNLSKANLDIILSVICKKGGYVDERAAKYWLMKHAYGDQAVEKWRQNQSPKISKEKFTQHLQEKGVDDLWVTTGSLPIETMKPSALAITSEETVMRQSLDEEQAVAFKVLEGRAKELRAGIEEKREEIDKQLSSVLSLLSVKTQGSGVEDWGPTANSALLNHVKIGRDQSSHLQHINNDIGGGFVKDLKDYKKRVVNIVKEVLPKISASKYLQPVKKIKYLHDVFKALQSSDCILKKERHFIRSDKGEYINTASYEMVLHEIQKSMLSILEDCKDMPSSRFDENTKNHITMIMETKSARQNWLYSGRRFFLKEKPASEQNVYKKYKESADDGQPSGSAASVDSRNNGGGVMPLDK